MMRAFIAVDVQSGGAISRLQSEIVSETGWATRDVKPVETPNFHFTIIFLGEITEIDAGKIISKLSEVQFEPFPLSYTEVGAFPGSKAARIVWVGVDPVGGEKLTDLAKKVLAPVSELGFKPDKPFSAHLTIFRVKTRQAVNFTEIADRYRSMTFGTEIIDKFHLKKSDLKSSGPVYSNIYTVEAKK